MAEKLFYIGSLGPFYYDTADVYTDVDAPGYNEEMAAVVGPKVRVTETPTADTDTFRLIDANGRILQSLEVADINNPTELSTVDGASEGTLLVAYQIRNDVNLVTFYTYDLNVPSGSNSPFVVDALTSGARWVAIGGYNASSSETSAGFLGPELLTNGSFSGDAAGDWTFSGTWVWDDLDLTMHRTAGSVTYLEQTVPVVNGRLYRVEIVVTGYSASLINALVGGGTASDAISSNGTHVFTLQASNVNSLFRITPTATTVLNVDRVSLREILELDFDLGVMSKLGVGTKTPTTKLHVASSDTSSSPAAQIQQSSTGDAGLTFRIGVATKTWAIGIDNSETDDPFVICESSSIGSSERVRISERGLSLGGYAFPAIASGWLNIGGAAGHIMFGTTETGSTQWSNNAYYDGSNWRYVATGTASNIYHSAGTIVCRVAGSGTGGNSISWTNALLITSSGNVGVKTSPAVTGLDVAGNMRVYNSGGDTDVQLRAGSGNEVFVKFVNPSGTVVGFLGYSHTSTNLTWGAGSTFPGTGIALDSSGNVSMTQEVKGQKLHVPYNRGNISEYNSGTRTYIIYPGGQSIVTQDYAFRMIRAGSITGVSFNTNFTAIGTSVSATLEILKNGSVVWSHSIAMSTGQKNLVATQARGTDTFVAGDVIGMQLVVNKGGSNTEFDCTTPVALLEVYYDA